MNCLSLLYSEWKQGPHGKRIKEWEIDDRDCLETTKRLWALGFPVGPSSGLNYAASLAVRRHLGPDARVVTVFPDRMERYFSHKVFDSLR
jgi:cysteine synthase A